MIRRPSSRRWQELSIPCLSGGLPSGSNAEARSVQRDAEKALGETFAASAPLRLSRLATNWISRVHSNHRRRNHSFPARLRGGRGGGWCLYFCTPVRALRQGFPALGPPVFVASIGGRAGGLLAVERLVWRGVLGAGWG